MGEEFLILLMVTAVKRIKGEGVDPSKGSVEWGPVKSLWFLANTLIAIVGCVGTFSWDNFVFFLVLTSITLCLGHSLGMHRKLIHNSFECPMWLEYFLVHLGIVVGIAGPKGMIYQHDLRDWAQRQATCHSYLRHGENFWKDAWWQINCDLKLDTPVVLELEEKIVKNRMYQFMDNFWMLQQLPWAVLFYFLGGVEWLVWGISVRVVVSIIGHWLIGYFAHNKGIKEWYVLGAAVQGHNVPFLSLITMGESLHNNHHAFPGSAKLSLKWNELDPVWWVLSFLKIVGLAWDIKIQSDLEPREELIRVSAL